MNKKMDKLTKDVQKIKEDIQEIKEDIQDIKKAQEHNRRINAIVSCKAAPPQFFLNTLVTPFQLYNRSQGTGDDTALEIVLLGNGEDPTKPPV